MLNLNFLWVKAERRCCEKSKSLVFLIAQAKFWSVVKARVAVEGSRHLRITRLLVKYPRKLPTNSLDLMFRPVGGILSVVSQASNLLGQPRLTSFVACRLLSGD